MAQELGRSADWVKEQISQYRTLAEGYQL